MCYPKPGPRCSAHAKERYIMLRHKQRALTKKRGGYSFEEYAAIQEEIDAAELDYDSTPVGQARLELRLKQEMDYNGEIAERLAKVKEMRRLQLAAVKAQDAGDLYNHGDTNLPWKSGDLLSPRKHRKNWKSSRAGAKLVTEYIAYAKNFAQKLSTEEANALYWHTSDGSGVLNDIIHKKENAKSDKWSYEKLIRNSGTGKKYPQAMIKNQVKTLDGIFAKHPLPEPVVVYRGIGMNNFPDEITSISDQSVVDEYLQDKYPVGETIEIPEYMSTSADPAIGHKFAGLGQSVILEIKTKRAVPVGMVSAWDVDEREFVVNRNGKYKVLGIHKKVTYEDVYIKSRTTGPHNKNVTVIQLEEA